MVNIYYIKNSCWPVNIIKYSFWAPMPPLTYPLKGKLKYKDFPQFNHLLNFNIKHALIGCSHVHVQIVK